MRHEQEPDDPRLEQFVTIKAVAQACQVDRHTVSKWIDAGIIVGAVRLSACGWRIPLAEVRRLVEESRRGQA